MRGLLFCVFVVTAVAQDELSFRPFRVSDFVWNNETSWNGTSPPEACERAIIENASYVTVVGGRIEAAESLLLRRASKLFVGRSGKLRLLGVSHGQASSPNVTSTSRPPIPVPLWETSSFWKPSEKLPSANDVARVPKESAIVNVSISPVYALRLELGRSGNVRFFRSTRLLLQWPCTRGSIANGTVNGVINITATGCRPCLDGTVPLNLTQCVSCAAGSSWISNFTCQKCTEGSFQDQPGQSQCLPCPLGTSQSMSGSQSCLDCPAGTFRNASMSGMSCLSCPAGSWSSKAQSQCTQCTAGTYNNATGRSSPCQTCPFEGQSSAEGSTRESDCRCPELSQVKGSRCVCVPGTGAVSQNPLVCIACDATRYKRDPGNSACFKCPENSLVVLDESRGTGALSEDECICINNRFRNNSVCVQCVKGGNCTSGMLAAADGFWRPNSSFQEFVQCIPTAACVGGSPPPSVNTTLRMIEGCAPGYEDFACATCSTGYAWSGSKCSSCSGPNWGIIVLLIVLSIGFCIYIYLTVGKGKTAKVAILVNYLQLLAQSYFVEMVKFAPVVEINWPVLAEASSGGSCVFPFNYWQLFVFIMCIPLILLFINGWIFFGHLVYRRVHRAKKHPNRECHQGKMDNGELRPSPLTNAVQAGVMLILFNYLRIAKSSLSMFACVDVFGRQVLSVYHGFTCGTPLHYGLIAFSVIWLLIFCIAVPVVVLVRIIFSESERFSKHLWFRKLDVRFLTIHFRDKYKWWETVFILRRLIFAVIVTVATAAPRLKVLLFTFFAVGFMVAHTLTRPYKLWFDNFLELLGLAAISITFALQSYVLAYGDPDDAVPIFCVVLNSLIAAFILFWTI